MEATKSFILKKGFDLNITGKAKEKIIDIGHPETYAIKPTDFKGLTRPKLYVKEGDNVKAGTPLFYDKVQEKVKFVSPVSGEIVKIKRGSKRKLLEIVVLADNVIEYENFRSFSFSEIIASSRDEIVDTLCSNGSWVNIIQRPFGTVADVNAIPKAIHISTFDTNPLAPNYDFTLKGHEKHIKFGIEAIKKLTSGRIHINTNSQAEVSSLYTGLEGVVINKFLGPHPAGNVGVQIHHIDPINKGDVVWTLTPYAIAQIGACLINGKYDGSKIYAISGSSFSQTGYFKSYVGACINKIIPLTSTENQQ